MALLNKATSSGLFEFVPIHRRNVHAMVFGRNRCAIKFFVCL